MMTVSGTSSPPRRITEQAPKGDLDYFGCGVRHLAIKISFQAALAASLIVLPSQHKALAAPPGQALLQFVQLAERGSAAIGRSAFALSEQPQPDGLRSVVEFLAPVAPKCRPMAGQQTDKECQKREPWTFEKFVKDHPVLSNVLMAIVTGFVGFILGGGLQGGK
jgi:hypothetical protein